MALIDEATQLKRLGRKARAARFRAELGRAATRLALWFPLPLTYAVGALTYIKLRHPDAELERRLVELGVVPLAVALVGISSVWFRRAPMLSGAARLDAHHGLAGRVGNALVFGRLPMSERTSFMRAAVEDALPLVRDLSPRRAVPIQWPGDLWISAVLAGVVFVVARTELPVERRVTVTVPSIDPMVLSPDDIALFEEVAEQLDEKSSDPEVRAAVHQFNQLIEDLADHRLERLEVFRKLEELERGLLDGSAEETEALDEGLEGVAKELEKSELTRPAAEALERKNLADAEEALKKLAERLRNKKEPNRAALERVRKALETASRHTTKRMERLEQRRAELQEQQKRLLQQQQDPKAAPSAAEQAKKNERRLERLDRERRRAGKSKEALSELDRDLAEAAKGLFDDMGASADAMDRGAEDINRAEQKKLSQAEKKALLERLKEMREILRQQGKGGKERVRRMMRFGDRARGGAGRPGKPGEGQPGGEGKPGAGQKPSTRITLGPGPGRGSGALEMPGGGAAPGGESGEGQGEGAAPGGDEWGRGHDANLAGKASTIGGETQDVAAVGVDTGKGPSTSEVVYGAANRGFVGRGYRQVYTDCKTVAEQLIESDEIPAGYEFYVRRYFQLIRPRD